MQCGASPDKVEASFFYGDILLAPANKRDDRARGLNPQPAKTVRPKKVYNYSFLTLADDMCPDSSVGQSDSLVFAMHWKAVGRGSESRPGLYSPLIVESSLHPEDIRVSSIRPALGFDR